MHVSKEFKVGIMVILGILLILIGSNFLKAVGPFATAREFSAEFEASMGLLATDEVQMNGVQIGEVSSVDLKEDDANRIIVTFLVQNSKIKIPKNSEIWLISTDILGTKALDLRIPEDSLRPEQLGYYEDGARFNPENVRIEMSMGDQFDIQIEPIRVKTKELVTRVEDIILSVNAFWDTSAAYTIDASMYDVRDASERYTTLGRNINSLIKNATSKASEVTKNMKTYANIHAEHVNTYSAITSNFAAVSNTIASAHLQPSFDEAEISFLNLDSTLAKIKNGKGTIGQLSNGTTLKDNIALTKASLDTLSNSIGANPKSFIGFSIFGLKVRGYQPGRKKEKLLDGMLDSLDSGKSIEYE